MTQDTIDGIQGIVLIILLIYTVIINQPLWAIVIAILHIGLVIIRVLESKKL